MQRRAYFGLFGDSQSDLTNLPAGEPKLQVFVKIASASASNSLVARLPIKEIGEFSSLNEVVSIQILGRSLHYSM
jgi:hypothetical protein